MFGQVTTIIGTAKDAKFGAVVFTTNSEIYYLDNLEAWDKDVVGKQVSVTGKVVVKKPRKPESDDEINAEITTPIKIIRRYKVKII